MPIPQTPLQKFANKKTNNVSDRIAKTGSGVRSAIRWHKNPRIVQGLLAGNAVLGTVVGLMLFTLYSDGSFDRVSSYRASPGAAAVGEESEAQIVSEKLVYETQTGQRGTVTLPDGSIVTLNTASRLEVDFNANERNVTLVRGQGFFDVAKDKTRKFSVIAGGKRLVAYGTAFDVRVDPDESLQVTMLQGRVSVDEIEDDKWSIAHELRPGERLIARKDAATDIGYTDIDEATSWRNGRLTFRNTSLNDAIAEFNRYRSSKIILSDDPRLSDIFVTGVFSAGDASSFIDNIKENHAVEIRPAQGRNAMIVYNG